jgi:uncharacterized protein with von Willebrand factor type A (vWA) domain
MSAPADEAAAPPGLSGRSWTPEQVPEPTEAEPGRLFAGFATALRGAGVAVPTGAVIAFAQAVGLVGLENPERLYWAGMATLIRRPEDFDAYRRVFAAFWGGVGVAPAPTEVHRTVTVALDDDGGDSADAGETSEADGDVKALRWSSLEVLAERDLSGLSEEEWLEANRLISAMKVTTDLRPSRRTRPSRRHAGRHPDLRSTIRDNIRHGGTPIRRAWREQVQRPRKMVFLLDVSGSMDSYARAMARFAHAAVSSRRAGSVEVFTIGTRLSRVTRQMAKADPEAALRQVAAAVPDWSGGTRLGESMGDFNQKWGVRGMARGAVVVICSDGWDRGDPEVMDAEMARLARVAHKVIWVNPLKATPGYAPLARGMAAALAHVDVFVEGHSVSSLQQLARLVVGQSKTPGGARA